MLVFYSWAIKKAIRPLATISLTSKNLLFSLLLTLTEYYCPQLFPTHPGHSWMPLAPYLGLSSIFGVPLLSLASTWLSFVIWRYTREKKWDVLGIVFFGMVLLVNLANPLIYNTKSASNTTIRMVQANIGGETKVSSRKGNKRTLKEVASKYFDLSSSLGPGADLIIWPETAYPKLLNSKIMRSLPKAIPDIVHATTRQNRAHLVLGGYDKAKKYNPYRFETEYNSLFLFDRNGLFQEVYHKRILMPFGERLPIGPLNSWASKYLQNLSFFAKGMRFPRFELDNDVSFIAVICYEILFSNYLRNYLNAVQNNNNNVHFILNITNDSWYGKTAEPYQHQFLSHWRAIEFQMPVVRVTNTGLSSILYPNGKKSTDMGLFSEQVRDIVLSTKALKPTMFQRYGLLPLLILVAIVWSFYLLLCQIPLSINRANE